ncbi:MAG TPA: hypothetical protein VMW56_28565 [Candidatus Margulisiibacteriota bacterium]|nr:hypothetical protein [Candidatus Margulisiibacteriota bacterium]
MVIGCTAGGTGALAKRQPQKAQAIKAAAPDTRNRFVLNHHIRMAWLVDYGEGRVNTRRCRET